MLARIVIDAVRPSTPTGEFPAKAAVGERVVVSADIFKDGHDALAARVRWAEGVDSTGVDGKGDELPMVDAGNDRWEGVVEPTHLGLHHFTIEAWVDHWGTWRHHVEAKLGAGQSISSELLEGARLLDVRAAALPPDQASPLVEAAVALRDGSREPGVQVGSAMTLEVAGLMTGPLWPSDVTVSAGHRLWVDRDRALTGAWYELFPRSEGGFVGTARRLPAIAKMGFDVVYFPPVHPIGRTHRKGPGNVLDAGPDDPGSPWAIGSAEGGHTAIHPELGSVADFEAVVAKAQELGMEVALDFALQCSPDHPWVKAHPEWFHHRADGTISYAENPPKKYQDIYPVNFWPEDDSDRVALWEACREILDVWIARGVRMFRVDNPHTKPLAFWAWCLADVQSRHPDVVFLAEAFTRPKMMAKLAEVGFSQSYTYFTWRTARWELAEYLEEITEGRQADYMRPNLWPNTPDILSGPLRRGPRSAFALRALLAATMAPSWGVYAGYELAENQPASELNEEYARSEKYELKRREWSREDSLAPFIGQLNAIRRRHPALQRLRGAVVHGSENDQLFVYSRRDGDDAVLVVANLDPLNPQAGWLQLELDRLGLEPDVPIEALDELTGNRFIWRGENPWVRLDPADAPGHVLQLRPL